MGWLAGDDMPRTLSPAAFRRPQRQKGRPRNGAAHDTESDRITVRSLGANLQASEILNQAEAHHTWPIGLAATP